MNGFMNVINTKLKHKNIDYDGAQFTIKLQIKRDESNIYII